MTQMRRQHRFDKPSKREQDFWASYDKLVAPYLKQSLDNTDLTLDHDEMENKQ